ncbi:MAG TPA: transglutaminase-like domain-containing protein, partial [Candidatus Sulfotelmatobacter sp.]|nr:transglutaminase-like domain-containing protein [Candidatus Sulfotelmatobacter sp.]
MKQLLLAVSCIWLVASAHCLAQQKVLDQVNQLELQGHFREAANALTQARTSKALSAAECRQLEFELDRLERIKKDFLYTKEGLFAELQKSVKGLTADEYEHWITEGRFDSREIDGQRYFMSSSVSNLFFRHAELNARRRPPKNTRKLDQAHWETCQQIQQAALAQKTPYVLPKRFHITMTITAKPNAVPAGEVVRAWLPIPRQYPFQTDFQLVSASPKVQHLDDEQSPIRCAYLEQPARKNRATEFEIQYDYTLHGVWFDIHPETVRTCDVNDPALQPFLREAPHVVFTPEMRALSQQIAGAEANPYLKARQFYNWIAEHIQYSYAIEYSTIRNISDYCRTKGYGDCGQEALLFITLCRLNGIPARWQSGWST